MRSSRSVPRTTRASPGTSDVGTSDVTGDSPSQLEAWVLAARPKTLAAAVAPVIVGASLAAGDDVFTWARFLVTVFAAVCIQIGVNFANDLSDATSGADNEDRVGPRRAVSSGWISPSRMKAGIAVAFGMAVLAGIYLIWAAGWVVLVIGVTAIVAALGYTGGPFPYGYRGLGELFVFIYFGLAATVGTRYVFDRSAPADAWVAAVAMGLFASAILEANNIRDVDTDRAAGKHTLAVLLGRRVAAHLYAATITSAFVVLAAGAGFGVLPPWSALSLLAAPLAVPLVRTVYRETAAPALISVLVGTSRIQLVAALLFATGAVVG